MPYRRKDSAVWWVSCTDSSGQRIRRTTGTTDRKEAEALEAKWKLEAHQQKHWGEKQHRTFEEVMLAYLKAYAHKRSADKDRMRTKHLRQPFAGQEMHALQASDIRRYINHRQAEGIANATINRELSLLSAAINHANTELDWELPNPVCGRKLKEPEGRVRWLTVEEAERLISVAESLPKAKYLADFIRLALNTGCRSGELLGLEWNRVDLERGLIHLEASHTKAGKRRSIPINQTARAALFSLQNPSRWVFSDRAGQRIASVKTSFANACRLASIEDFRIHDLRHTCAAWLVSAGVPLTEVRDLLGHSTVQMTERYAHLAPENIRAAVARLDAWSRSGHVTEKSPERSSGGLDFSGPGRIRTCDQGNEF
jgi:integrase